MTTLFLLQHFSTFLERKIRTPDQQIRILQNRKSGFFKIGNQDSSLENAPSIAALLA